MRGKKHTQKNTHENKHTIFLSIRRQVFGKLKGCDTHPRVGDNGDPVVIQGSCDHIGEGLNRLLLTLTMRYVYYITSVEARFPSSETCSEPVSSVVARVKCVGAPVVTLSPGPVSTKTV